MNKFIKSFIVISILIGLILLSKKARSQETLGLVLIEVFIIENCRTNYDLPEGDLLVFLHWDAGHESIYGRMRRIENNILTYPAIGVNSVFSHYLPFEHTNISIQIDSLLNTDKQSELSMFKRIGIEVIMDVGEKEEFWFISKVGDKVAHIHREYLIPGRNTFHYSPVGNETEFVCWIQGTNCIKDLCRIYQKAITTTIK